MSDRQVDDRREHVVAFIEERAADAPGEAAVVPLAGGVGSSLTAALAVKALGPAAVTGMIMPGRGTDPENRDGAERVVRWLAIDHEVVDVAPILEAVLAGYPVSGGAPRALEPVRASLRAAVLQHVASHVDAILLGTGTRTERLLGAAPKYGPVDCLPIGNLYEQQVRQLARAVGVPEPIVERPPTGDWWAEEIACLGCDADAAAAVVALHIDGPDPSVVTIRDARPSETILAFDADEPLSIRETADLVGVDPEVVKRIRRRHRATERERRGPPAPAPRV